MREALLPRFCYPALHQREQTSGNKLSGIKPQAR